MQTELEFLCDWCGHRFPRRHPNGRKPLYCTRACRQRAYEQRRAHRADPSLRKPLPTFHIRPNPDDPRRYEATVGILRRVHALRPDGVPDERGRRPTLCGTYAHAHGSFLPGGPRSCRTCSPIALRHPPRWTIRPDVELPVMRAAILRLAASLGPSADELVNLAIAA